MDALTMTVLAVQQPRRAVRHRPTSMREWCARCYERAHGALPAMGCSLPTMPDWGVPGECLSCRQTLEYHDMETP